MKYFAPVLALLWGLLLAGCDTGPDTEAYGRIENGMSRDQVHELLGTPDETIGGGPGRTEGETDTTESTMTTDAPGTPGGTDVDGTSSSAGGATVQGSFTELWHQGDQTIAVQYVDSKVTLKTIESMGSEHPATAQPPQGEEEPDDTRNLEEATERPSGTPPQRVAPEAGDARKEDERPAAEFP